MGTTAHTFAFAFDNRLDRVPLVGTTRHISPKHGPRERPTVRRQGLRLNGLRSGGVVPVTIPPHCWEMQPPGGGGLNRLSLREPATNAMQKNELKFMRFGGGFGWKKEKIGDSCPVGNAQHTHTVHVHSTRTQTHAQFFLKNSNKENCDYPKCPVLP